MVRLPALRRSTPDILTCAKALAGGVAAGVMIATAEVAATLKPGMHASTFGGNPIACRAGLATIETIEAGRPARARPGDRRAVPRPLRGDPRPSVPGLVRDIRILGVMIGLDLTVDASAVVADCLERRLLINATHGHVVRLLPALTITDEQIDEGCADPGRRAPSHWPSLSVKEGRSDDPPFRRPVRPHAPTRPATCSTGPSSLKRERPPRGQRPPLPGRAGRSA